MATGPGAAFTKGGAGCLGLFLALAVLAVATGGRVMIDLVGVIFLFVLGGLVGLLVLYIYRRGQRSATAPPNAPPPVELDAQRGTEAADDEWDGDWNEPST